MNKYISLALISALSSISYAQNSTNIGNRNDSASCDSTCMAQAQQKAHESNLQQRIVPCISGFSGTRLQTRVKLADGSWSPWTDKDIDSCVCTPTFQDRTGVCPAGQKGSVVERSNWTCTGPKSGVWSEWSTHTNNCYTPCVAAAPETRTIACPSNYTGTQTQTRTSSCSSDDKLPPSWSSWTTVSSNCTYNPSVPACETEFTGKYGPPEVCREVQVGWEIVSYSSFYKCQRYGEWVDCEPIYGKRCDLTPIYTTCP